MHAAARSIAKTSVLGRERHLDVDLRELGLAIGAQVLVAEALDDLEVAVEPADHQDLLEDLRRLRQRVELARVHAARHEVVARALRACDLVRIGVSISRKPCSSK